MTVASPSPAQPVETTAQTAAANAAAASFAALTEKLNYLQPEGLAGEEQLEVHAEQAHLAARRGPEQELEGALVDP